MFRNFPKVIFVGSIPIDIEICSDCADGEDWGNFVSHKYLIRLAENIPSSGKAVEVVIHELLHAIYSIAGIHSGDDEERVVTAFSTWLGMVLMQNPGLVKWIASATK